MIELENRATTSQDETKEITSQDKAKEETSQEKAKEETSQEKAKEETSQEKAKEETSQEKAKEETTQEKAKEETSQERAKEETSQEKANQKTSQEKAKEETSQDTSKAETSLDKAEEEISQDKAEKEISQEKAKEKTSQEKTKEETSQDKPKEETSQDKAKEEISHDRPKGETSQGNTKQRTSQGITTYGTLEGNIRANVNDNSDDERRPLLLTVNVPARRTSTLRNIMDFILITILFTIVFVGIGIGTYLLINQGRRFEKQWITRRTDWSAIAYPLDLPKIALPAGTVVLVSTRSRTCWSKSDCISLLRKMQKEQMGMGLPDIGYNFMIGNDGQLYEGRGWDYLSNFKNYNNKHIVVAFIGFYDKETPSAEQIEVIKKLLEYGYESRNLLRCHNVWVVEEGWHGLTQLATDLEVNGRKRFHCYYKSD